MSALESSNITIQRREPLAKMTLLLIIINVGLFAFQIFNGVDIQHPAIRDALAWGADYAPLTYLAEPFRLFSSMFFHFGLIHLMFNMWALYSFGQIAEHTFGRSSFLLLYICAGLGGSLCSGLIDIVNSFKLLEGFNPDNLPRVTAGASGAVMGLGGALTMLSLFKPLAQQAYILNKKSLLLILGINLLIGLTIPGINNAAHLGGMIVGAFIALLWRMFMVSSLQPYVFWILSLIMAALLYLIYQLNLSALQQIQPIWAELVQLIQTELQSQSP